MKDSVSSIIHLDLLGTIEESRKNLTELLDNFEEKISKGNVKRKLTSTNEFEYIAKFSEMMGHKLPYSFMANATNEEESSTISNELVSRVECKAEKKINYVTVEFPNREIITYNNKGKIMDSTNKNLIGKSSLEYISCNVHEDFGVITKRGDSLVYSFDSAMFEKTPKHVITGKNLFIGRDMLEFHSKAKNFGNILPDIFRKMEHYFSEKKLDALVIDLRGNNVYTDGKIQVRRFERDYAVPMFDKGFKGFLVYTDVFFQEINEQRSPFDGGSYINIECPIKFALDFGVVR